MLKNLAVGHFYNEPFIEACTPWTGRIREVFFAWPGVLSCRPAPEFTDEVRARLYSDLQLKSVSRRIPFSRHHCRSE